MYDRNVIAHGGDILGDLQALQYVEENGLKYVTEYKDDFQKAYNIRFDEALGKLLSFPHKVIWAFDILASVRELQIWNREHLQSTKERIEWLASEIITAALGTDINQLPARFGKDDDLAVKYSGMDNPCMVY